MLLYRCREWVVDCRGIDRMKEVTNPHNRCHLCEDHFVSLQPQQDFEECAPVPEHGGELGTSAPLLDEIKDSGSVTTIIQVSNVGDLKPIEVNLLPLETQTTVAKDEAIRQPVLSSESHWPQPNLSAHPCLPSSFFSIRGFTSHLAKVLGRDIPAPSSVGCKFVQTDGTLKSQREFILYKKVASCRVQICRLKKRIETLEAGAKKPVQISIQLLSKELSKYLSGACLRLVQEQLKVNKANNRGIRWSEDLITLAKIIRNESFKAYSILKRIISLPTRTTIKRHPVPPEGLPNLTEFLKTAFTSDISPGTKENVKHNDDCDVEHDEKDNYMMEEPCVSEEIDVPGDDVLKAVEDEVALEEQRTMAAAQSLQDTNSCIQLTPVLGASDALHIYEVFAQTAATLHGDGEIHLQVPTTDAVVVNNAQ